MPKLDTLKKRAKQYLRWHRDGYFPVAARIRAGLPRFRELTDRQILAAEFKLADAQELIARHAGFETWEALRKGIETMPNQPANPAITPTAAQAAEQVADRPILLAAEPQLFVRDLAASIAFFTDKLGFAEAFRYGEPPFYAQVVRDGARLNLRQVDTPVADPARAARDDLLAASITLDDAKPLFLAYQAAGVAFHQALRTEPWGARTFIVRDPDGNLILFAGKDG